MAERLEIQGTPSPENLAEYRQELTAVLTEFQTPPTLEEAQQAVLQLPGMENYLALTGSESEALSEMTTDFLRHTQALAEIGFVAYDTAMSNAKRDEVFSEPERTPYRTLLEEPKTQTDLLRQYLTVGSYLVHVYTDASKQVGNDSNDPKAKEQLEKASKDLRTFSEHSVYPIVRPLAFDLTDRIYGIDPQKRRDGTLTGPNEYAQGLITQSAHQIAIEYSMDQPAVEQAIYNATAGGDLQLVRTFLEDYAGPDYLRDGLVLLFEKIMGNRDLAIEKIQNTYLLELYKRKIGLTLAMGYTLNGFPELDTLEERFRAYLENAAVNKEVLMHVATEAPAAFRRALQALPAQRAHRILENGVTDLDELSGIAILNYSEIMSERNRRLGLPDTMPTMEELRRRNEAMAQEWQALSPLSAAERGEVDGSSSSAATVHTVESYGAARRASNCSYRSGDRNSSHEVNDSMLNPYEGDERYWRVNGHENTHGEHHHVFGKAEDAKVIEKGAGDAVGHGVKEMLALMVDHAAQMYFKHKRGININERPDDLKYADVKDALVHRVQGAYALSQLWIRQQIHQYIDREMFEFDRDVSAAIYDAVEPKVRQAHRFGIDIIQYRGALLFNLSEGAAYDGANYILGELDEEDSTISPVRRAFESQFGRDWLWGEAAPDARAIRYALYVETASRPKGLPQDMEHFAKFVTSTDPNEARRLLARIGIPEQYI